MWSQQHPTAVEVSAVTLTEANGAKFVVSGSVDGTLLKYRILASSGAAPTIADKPDLVIPQAHVGAIIAIVDLTNDEVATAGADGKIISWNLAQEVEGKRQGKIFPPIPVATKNKKGDIVPPPPQAPAVPVRCLVSSGEGVLFSGHTDGSVRKFEGFKSTQHWQALHTGAVTALAVVDATTLITAGDDRSIRGIDLASSKPIFVAPNAHSNAVRGLAAAPAPATFFSLGLDGKVALWQIPPPPEATEAAPADGADAPSPTKSESTIAPAAAAVPEITSAALTIDLPFAPASLASSALGIVVGAEDGTTWGVRSKIVLKHLADFGAQLEANFESAKAKLEAQGRELSIRAERASKKRVAQLRKTLEEEAAGGKAQVPVGEDEAPPAADLSAEAQGQITAATEAEAAQLEKTTAGIQATINEKINALAATKKQTCHFTKETTAAATFCHLIDRGVTSGSAAIVAADAAGGQLVASAFRDGGITLVNWRVGVVTL